MSSFKTSSPTIDAALAAPSIPTIKDIKAFLNIFGFGILLKIHFNDDRSVRTIPASPTITISDCVKERNNDNGI